MSVIAVQEKCDEKGPGAASGHRNVRCRQFGRAPSRKAREGAHPPVVFVSTLKDTLVFSSSLKWPTRRTSGSASWSPPAGSSGADSFSPHRWVRLAGGPAFQWQTTQWVPHPSRLFAKGGWRTDRTMGFAFHAACARNEIFPQPSFTRTGPGSSRK